MRRIKKPRKRVRPRNTRRSAKRKFVPPATLEEFLALVDRYQELWGDIGQIVTDVREKKTLAEAAREFGRSPRTVLRLAGPALIKGSNGRWAAKKHDRLLRVLPLLNHQGLFEVAVRDSRQASVIGKYWNAVDSYHDTGDASGLREFRGKDVIDADGKRVPLLTDLRELDRLGSAGVLSFESLYARVA
jgi:hypothetical protein